jgi:hypothetical protein
VFLICLGSPVFSRQALQRHLRAGKGVLTLHTAAICFDDWPLFPD